MYPQLYTAGSGMSAGQRTLQLVANNLANVRTPGFRPEHALFSSYLPAASSGGVEIDPVALRTLAARGVVLAGSWRPDTGGPLRETGAPLDLALTGAGWFRIETADGERLTRDGGFSRAEDGSLVTRHGNAVLDDKGEPVTLPAGIVTVAQDGTVRVDKAQVATLGLADASGVSLLREGASLWRALGETTRLDDESSAVRQGFVEESGVRATEELVTMVEAQRLFEMHRKMVDITANTVARRALELAGVR